MPKFDITCSDVCWWHCACGNVPGGAAEEIDLVATEQTSLVYLGLCCDTCGRWIRFVASDVIVQVNKTSVHIEVEDPYFLTRSENWRFEELVGHVWYDGYVED